MLAANASCEVVYVGAAVLVVKAGNTSQSTYSFQLSLTDPKTGLAVWEGEKEITKQGTRSSVGF